MESLKAVCIFKVIYIVKNVQILKHCKTRSLLKIDLFQENLKKKQQLPTAPSSLSSYRDTATTTAQPTVSHLPSQAVADLCPDVSNFFKHLINLI